MAKEISYLEAIREALFEEMRRDPKVFVLGEDVGAYGGAFGVTAGIFDEFGDARCLDTPISESAIVGVSIGASQRGYRPVAEMQFADFISCGFDQIVNQAATLRYRCGGRATCPIVVRAPGGGNVGGGLYHSQNPEAWFIHRPGLKVVAPSTPWDAKGLLKAAIRDDNPVMYFEHKYLYRRAKGPVPEGDEIVPIGVAADPAARERCDARHLRRDGAAVARGRRSAREGRGRGGGHRSAFADAVRQGGDLRVGREDQPPAHRARRREDARYRRRAVGGRRGRAVRGAGCAGHARHLSRYAPPFSQVLEHYNLPNADKIADALRQLAAY